MKRELKVWGQRWLIRMDNIHAISYLKIKKGYRCSWHQHKEKYNLFVVLRGELKIVVEELGKEQEIILKQGESLTVKPGQWHEFSGETDCECIEEMFVKYCENDIYREEVGGKIND